MSDRIEQIRAELLPFVAAAGDYAYAIQDRVHDRSPKDHLDSAFAQALTDADLCVQNFLEVAALARFPELAFFGEEYEQSPNTKYLKTSGELTLLVDPVDGTRFYADGRPYFNVVVSLVDAERYRFGILYMPALKLCVHALNGGGLYRATSEQLAAGELGEAFSCKSDSRLVLTYRHPEFSAALRERFEVIDINEEYGRNEDCPNINAIFLGKAAAFIGFNNSAIDWGVHAFLAREGGGACSDWQGNELPKLSMLHSRSFPETIASVDKALHAEIVEILSRNQ